MFSAALNQYRENSVLHCNICVKTEMKENEITKLMKEVIGIQTSIGWNDAELSIAQNLISDKTVTKFLAIDNDTRELLGYAILAPRVNNVWTLSQLAVLKECQNRKIGRYLMRGMLKDARKKKMTVTFETDESTMPFFKKSAESRVKFAFEKGESEMAKVKVTCTFETVKESTDRLVSDLDSSYPSKQIDYKGLTDKLWRYPKHLDFEKIYLWMLQQPDFNILFNELFKRCRGGKLSNFIRETTDQKMKVAYAKAFITCEYGNLIDEFHLLGIESEQDRIAVLKQYLDVGYVRNHIFYKNFKYFGISTEETMIELIRMSAIRSPASAVMQFHHLDFKNKQAMLELIDELFVQHLRYVNILFTPNTPKAPHIARLVETNGWFGNEDAAWIPYANITDQDTLFRIAAIGLKRSGMSYYSAFQKFGIVDEDKRLELFQIAAETAKDIAGSIVKFNITDEKKRILLAKWLTKFPRHSIAQYIDKFYIDREEDRLEIAKLDAARERGDFSAHVDNYKISCEEERKVLARIALEHSPTGFCRDFKKFEISNESDRLYFAELVLERLKPGDDFGIDIRRFEITDEQARIKLALKASSKGLASDYNPVDKYDISNEDTLFEMAKLTSVSRPKAVASTIHKYQIQDVMRRIELAKIIACQRDSKISEHIYKFCIHDQNILKEIALLEAPLDGSCTAKNIRKYGLIKESDRIEVALAIGAPCAPYFELFEITDKKVHKRIAAAAAASFDEYCLLNNLNKFTLDGDSWLEVGKIFARQHGRFLNIFFNTISFENPTTNMKLLWIAIKNTSDFFRSFTHPKNLPSCHTLLYRRIFVETDIGPYLIELKKECPTHLFAFIEQAPDPEVKKIRAQWVVFILGAKVIHNLSEEEFQEVLRNPILQEIVKLPDVLLHFKLGDRLVQTKSAVPPVSLASLIVNASYDIPKHKIFTEPKNTLTLLNGLYHIFHKTNMTQNERKVLMDHIFISNKPLEVLKRIRIVQSIFQLEGESKLQKPVYEIDAILFDLFKQKIPVGVIDQFADKFQATFGNFCDPNLLFIYGAKVRNANDEVLMKAFIKFVETILNGTFLQERYKNSLHLDTVFKGRGATLTEWKKGLKRPWDEKDCSDETTKVSFYELLKDKVKEHWHIDHALCPYLVKYFSEPKGVLQGIGEKLKELKQKETKKGEKLKGQEKGNIETHWLHFQRHCIRLMNPTLKPYEQKIEFLQMKKYFAKLNLGMEHPFAANIVDFERLFENVEYNYHEWTVEDCDDPESLFTCGSAVPGSCQKIEGDIELNKSLLAYVLDGKNRLLCVKNMHGKMMARAIFRILWDTKNQTPVLLVEPIYPDIVKPSITKAIVRLAKDRAQELGLPFAQNDDLKITYPGTLESLSSKAPYEYTDLGKQHKTNGVFEIKQT